MHPNTPPLLPPAPGPAASPGAAPPAVAPDDGGRVRPPDLPALLQLILERAMALIGAAGGAILLWDEGEQALLTQAWANQPAASRASRIALGEGLSGTVAARRAGLIVNDYRRWPGARRAIIEQSPITASLAEPLLCQERLVGVINLHNGDTGRVFTPRDGELLRLVADQAAIAIENVRLHAAALRREAQLEALLRASRSVMAGLDLQAVLEQIADEAARIAGCRHVKLLLVDREAGLLRVGVLRGITTGMASGFPLPVGTGLSGTVAATGEPLFIADTQNDPRSLLGRFDRAAGLRTYLGLPIRGRSEVLGVLTFNTEEPRTYSAEEVAYLQAFADQAAIALENARLYQAVHQSLQDLRRAQEELLRTEKLRALGQLAAGIAHDLNNMLAAVLGQIELLKIRVPDPVVREALGILETAAADGAGVVRRIQDFARQRPAALLRPCRLAEVVDEAVEITRPRWKDEAERRGLAIRIRTALEGLPDVLGNPAEIREALTNLLINAVEAMPGGGEITLEGATEAEAVLLTVRDTGVGMSADVQAKIFEPFFTTKGVRGTGLGLSLVYGIMERHGGRIVLESAPGKGTAFTLRFQRARGEDAPPPPAAPAALPGPGRVLLVDDDAMVRTTIAGLLRAVGAQVVEADGGAGALARLRQELPDLVVTDLGMPDMTGWEVAEAIKRLHPALPVILMTGWQDQAGTSQEQRRHVDAVLAKPTRLEDLLRAIRAVGERNGG